MQALLLGLVTPLVRRVLIALGVGIVTYTGYSAVIDSIKAHIVSEMSGLTGNALQIITLYGLPDAIGIILGAFTTAASLSVAKKFKIL